jgi:formylglycine-generating enzyme required for sulfatase activity
MFPWRLHPTSLSMKTLPAWILALCIALLSGAHRLPALTIPASEDTTGYQSKITSRASLSTSLIVDSTHVGFVYFNLDDIPEGSVVKMARFRLYTSTVKSVGAGLGIHRVIGQWNEAIPGAQPQFDASPFALVEPSKLGSRRFVTVDVTALVQDWINSAAENEGFAITSLGPTAPKAPWANVYIASKEGPTLGLPAILDVELQEVSEAGAPIALERLPEAIQALARAGTLKLQTVGQLPDALRSFLTPSISIQPSLPLEGGSLSLIASGVGQLNYQWTRNGLTLAGKTGPRLSVESLPAGTYAAVVSNGFSSVTSSPVVIQPAPPPALTSGIVLVNGGTLPSTSALGAVSVPSFSIGKTEVLWREWKEVQIWAAANGYTDLGYTGTGLGENHPVTNVNWYDALKWCNARSQMEGRTPVYSLSGTVYKTGQGVPTVASTANGYRLPTEAEWEFAARGGTQSKGYIYSGTHDLHAAGWYAENSGRTVHEAGSKIANELGLFDMSGNVSEWCFSPWQSVSSGPARSFRGGGKGSPAEGCAVATRASLDPAVRHLGVGCGFRYALNAVIEDFVSVSEGVLPSASLLGAVRVPTFSIGRTEVTWAEWQAVRDWAVPNGYSDLASIGIGTGADYPVTNVTWHDALKWCNARSQKEGRTPVYKVDGAVYKTGFSVPAVDVAANGYRLPSEEEWEFAARGGVQTRGYTYSGSNTLKDVGWFNENSVDKASPVASKAPNELGIFDMSGNVWEWCFSAKDGSATERAFRGGAWNGVGSVCSVASRNYFFPDYRGNGFGTGFRVAVSSAYGALNTMRVRADISEESVLEISPLGIRWENRGTGHRPGTLDGTGSVATLINGVSWLAEWPDNNTQSKGFSDFAELKPGYFATKVGITVSSSRMGEDLYEILQHPSEANNFTLRILLRDLWGGSDWHEIQIERL